MSVKGSLLVVMVAACGTDSIRVPITVPGRPALFSGRTNGGAWHSFAGEPEAKTTSYTVDVDGDFELALVCVHSNRAVVAGEVFGTFDDADVTIGSWQVPDCTEPATAVAPTIDITGQLDTQGNVAIDDRVRYVIGGEPFDLAVAEGLHDIVVHSNFTVLIEHDRELTESTSVGTLPIAARGTPMVSKSFSVSTDPDERRPIVVTTLETRNGTQFSWPNQPLDQAVFVPPEQLAANDTQRFEVYVQGGSGARWASLSHFDQVPPDFGLLPRLEPIATLPEGIAAIWSPLHAFYTTAGFVAAAGGGTGGTGTYVNEAHVTASKLWIERNSPSLLTFDDQVPGYRTEWSFAPVAWTFTVELWSPSTIIESLTHAASPYGR